MMKTLVFAIDINAGSEKIWGILWGKKTYPLWTKPFIEDSYYLIDEWKEGAGFKFVTPAGEGMYGKIDILKENRFVAFKHIGMVKDLKELPPDEESKKWSGSIESYFLNELADRTEVLALVQTDDNYTDFMNERFPLALNELKRLSEE